MTTKRKTLAGPDIRAGIPEKFDRSKTPKSGYRSKYAPNLNRSALGRMIGISRPHMSLILSGKITPKVETLIKLRDALAMDSIDTVHAFLSEIRKANNKQDKRKGK